MVRLERIVSFGRFLEEARVFRLHSLQTLNFASQILQKCVRYVESYELFLKNFLGIQC